MLFKALLVFLWILHPKSLKCSIVIDFSDRAGLYVSEYCPGTLCPIGSHTMCLYYNPLRPIGPRCSGFQNATISKGVAEKIVDLINEMRGHVAMGRERGKGNVTLPRGYGLYKLKWDQELATFAQIMANTCILRHDICRATKKFRNPGQLISVVRFTAEDWMPISHKNQFKERGLTQSKIEYAASEACKYWYQQKQYVTPEMITEVPNWYKYPTRVQGKIYLQLVDANTTHIGCGLSAYKEYVYTARTNKEIISNLIHIVCNFATEPQIGRPVYNTKPSGDSLCVGPTCTMRRCDCPRGSVADERCLCSVGIPTRCGHNQNCNPAVVLLPIFTVEDAPINARRQINHDTGNPSVGIVNVVSREEMPRYENGRETYDGQGPDSFFRRELLNQHLPNEQQNTQLMPAQKTSYIEDQPHFQEPSQFLQQEMKPESAQQALDTYVVQTERSLQAYTPKRYPVVKSRSFDRKPQSPPPNYAKPNNLGYSHRASKPRQSIFSRVPKFELPKVHMMATKDIASHNSQRKSMSHIKMDVAPRKDFSKAHQLLETYLNGKRTPPAAPQSPKPEPRKTVHIVPRFKSKPRGRPLAPKKKDYAKPIYMNETVPTPESKNINRYMKNKFHYPGFNALDEHVKGVDEKVFNEEADKKLMMLLDTLEQEVKHIELDVNEKEIFDAKLRKIYGNLVGRNPISLARFPEFEDNHKDTVNYDMDLNEHVLYDNIEEPFNKNFDKQIYETEDRVKELHSKGHGNLNTKSVYIRPMPRNQNSLTSYNDKNEPIDLIRNTFGDVLDYKKPGHKKYANNEKHTDKTMSHFRVQNVDHLKEQKESKNDLNSEKVKPIFPFDEEKHEDMPRFQYKNSNYLPQNKPHFYEDFGENKDRHMKQTGFNKFNDYDYDKEDFDDPLGAERRKYYQEKLDNLERKLHSEHANRHRTTHNEHEADRAQRLVRGRDRMQQLQSNHPKKSAHFYVPDRARSLHSFRR